MTLPRTHLLLTGFVCCVALVALPATAQDKTPTESPPPGPPLAQPNDRPPAGPQEKAVLDVEQMLRDAEASPTATTRPEQEEPRVPAAPEPENEPRDLVALLHTLKYPFLACLVLTGIHCYLGIHVISRGVIFVDLALAQMAALGGVLALLIGLEPHGEEAYTLKAWVAYAISLSTTLLGAALFATGRLKKQIVPQEAIIGIIYAVSSAMALLLLSKSAAHDTEANHMLVGRILFVGGDEVLKTTALYAVVGVFHWIFRRQFLTISLHPELAQAQGMALRWWDFLFYMSFGVVVTSSVHMAGVLLVFSFLIVPAVCAMLLARDIGTRLVFGWAIGFLASVLGLFLSAQFSLPPGESVVTTFGGLLVLVAVLRWLWPRQAT